MSHVNQVSAAALSYERLIELLSYDANTGVFQWRIAPSFNGAHRIGMRAGCKQKGYRSIKIGGVLYLEHRLAWLYIYGEWPREVIDHINGDGTDNRKENLRDAKQSQNMYNMIKPKHNTSGFKGVSRYPGSTDRWRAYISVGDKCNKSLGIYSSPEEAAEAYIKAARSLVGDFACDGTR